MSDETKSSHPFDWDGASPEVWNETEARRESELLRKDVSSIARALLPTALTGVMLRGAPDRLSPDQWLFYATSTGNMAAMIARAAAEKMVDLERIAKESDK